MNEFQAFALVGGLASVLVGITLETMLSRRADVSAPLAGAATVVFSSAGVGLALSPLLVATMRTGTLFGYGAGLVSFLLLGVVMFRIIEAIRGAAQARALPDH
ncbi:hypothetical protein ACFQL1_24130 [Halomicroarcula sp. GCM10025709]|uniref:hypothetical protein n=1 Tax=Haloarcula TaxID=2237 RepID=UPI0024C3CC99|nr:hypothetical protein [Halomicroarcula sp. YJ-61-S]